MPAPRAAVIGLAAAAGAGHLLPSVAAIAPLRTALTAGRPGHVALTFDDGPGRESTPRVLDALAAVDVRATFFVLGPQLRAHPEIGRRLVEDGHEIAVHGWSHRAHLLRSPFALPRDLARTVDCVRDLTGRRPRYWRPPHGIPTGAGVLAARRLGLQPVLWTADGQDWRRAATATSVHDRIVARLTPGAVVLLHDSDRFCARGSWRVVVDVLPRLVEHCRTRGWPLGPLSEPAAARAAATDGGRHAYR